MSHTYHTHHTQHSEFWHYAILVLILTVGLVGFVAVGDSSPRKFIIGTLVTVGYTLWGIFHHFSAGELNYKLVIEYSVLSLCALSVLWAFLYL